MRDEALTLLISRVSAETTLPVDVTAPVLASLHCIAAAPDGSPLTGYSLDCLRNVVTEAWPANSELGRDVLAYVQACRNEDLL